MSEDRSFVDFYRILNVSPDCEAKALEAAYRHLAKLYHPDHPETADTELFSSVIEAYRALRSHERRMEYDEIYSLQTGYIFSPVEGPVGEDKEALTDAESHSRILLHLYRRRREYPKEPGLGHHSLMEYINCSDENFDFHIWYLKEKGFVGVTENGLFAITIEGVDHVISTSRTAAAERLRLSQSLDS
ncbi:MAG: J domain-containing protein [Pseudomonadota bacterium]